MKRNVSKRRKTSRNIGVFLGVEKYLKVPFLGMFFSGRNTKITRIIRLKMEWEKHLFFFCFWDLLFLFFFVFFLFFVVTSGIVASTPIFRLSSQYYCCLPIASLGNPNFERYQFLP